MKSQVVHQTCLLSGSYLGLADQIQQVLHVMSQDVLALPHLIQGSERERERGGGRGRERERGGGRERGIEGERDREGESGGGREGEKEG